MKSSSTPKIAACLGWFGTQERAPTCGCHPPEAIAASPACRLRQITWPRLALTLLNPSLSLYITESVRTNRNEKIFRKHTTSLLIEEVGARWTTSEFVYFIISRLFIWQSASELFFVHSLAYKSCVSFIWEREREQVQEGLQLFFPWSSPRLF